MESVLLIALAFVVGYILVYTPLGKMLGISGANSASSKGENEHACLKSKENKLVVPEDSTLKRHFLSQLRTDIESEVAPRPTCSMLKRHYDALISVEMENRLQVV